MSQAATKPASPIANLTMSCLRMSTTHMEDRPLYSIGLIADIQYADRDDAPNFARTRTRRYRGALKILKEAVSYWNEQKIDMLIQLGDLIDGCNSLTKVVPRGITRGGAVSESALATVLNELNQVECKERIDIIGNHELYNFSFDELAERLNTRRVHPDGVAREYYSVLLEPKANKGINGQGQGCGAQGEAFKLKLIVLNSYQVATIGHEIGSPPDAEAWDILMKNNPNLINYGVGSKDWSLGLEGLQKRYLPYNGALGKDQREWLRGELEQASQKNQKCIIISHVALYTTSPTYSTLVWDCRETMQIIHSYPGTVIMVLSGHDHDGQLCFDKGRPGQRMTDKEDGKSDDNLKATYVTPTPHYTPYAPIECDEGKTVSLYYHSADSLLLLYFFLLFSSTPSFYPRLLVYIS